MVGFGVVVVVVGDAGVVRGLVSTLRMTLALLLRYITLSVLTSNQRSVRTTPSPIRASFAISLYMSSLVGVVLGKTCLWENIALDVLLTLCRQGHG